MPEGMQSDVAGRVNRLLAFWRSIGQMQLPDFSATGGLSGGGSFEDLIRDTGATPAKDLLIGEDKEAAVVFTPPEQEEGSGQDTATQTAVTGILNFLRELQRFDVPEDIEDDAFGAFLQQLESPPEPEYKPTLLERFADLPSCVMSGFDGANYGRLDGTWYATNATADTAVMPVWWKPIDVVLTDSNSDTVTTAWTMFLWYCSDTSTLTSAHAIAVPSACWVITDHEPRHDVTLSNNNWYAVGPLASNYGDPTGTWSMDSGCGLTTGTLAWNQQEWTT